MFYYTKDIYMTVRKLDFYQISSWSIHNRSELIYQVAHYTFYTEIETYIIIREYEYK